MTEALSDPRLRNSLPLSKSDAPVTIIPHFPIPTLPRVSVIIPALNERDNLPYVIPRVPDWVHEVVLVDGDSIDDTVQVACDLWPNDHIVLKERRYPVKPKPSFERERRNHGITLRIVTQTGVGKGAALRSGFTAATGDIIVTLDADGSNDPAEIPAFVGILLAGFDYAKGSRFLEGGGTSDMPFYRKLGNWGLTMTVRFLFGGRYSDLCYGFNAFWADVVPALNLHSDGFEIETLINVRVRKAKLRITEVPSFESKRIYGSGRLRTIPDGWRVLRTILEERFHLTPVNEVRPKRGERAIRTVNPMFPSPVIQPSFDTPKRSKSKSSHVG